ncbi:MAG: wax ester/triacylglycerol synthase family O-acyltransferase [Gammaproteobacteria bacterium]|nr:wax ester/triacylglycerol synthase family O-acyltransferase [Gammaproteobacteria bacterium]
MQKLGAVDANFLYTETQRMPNHIASVQRFELPEGITPTEWVESLRDYVLARRHRVDYLHRKLQFVPGNFDHPLWVEATDLDMTQHIVEVRLPAPGSTAQMEQAIADIHGRLMDRTRPLWNMHVITGLDDGDVAVYNQIHHAAIDGLAGQAATMQLMDTTPKHEPVEEGLIDADETGLAEQLQRSFENLVKYQIGSTSRMLGSLDTLRRLTQRAIDPSSAFGAFGKAAPFTRFSRPVGPERVYAGCEVEFSDIRSMSRHLGCTVNDVFMAICAGGLRRYLQRQGELPATSLIAGCPVSLRQPDDDKSGNQVTMMTVDLATNVEDPKTRLLSIHAVCSHRERSHGGPGWCLRWRNFFLRLAGVYDSSSRRKRRCRHGKYSPDADQYRTVQRSRTEG